MLTHPESWELLERADSELESLLEPESPTRPLRGRSSRQSRRILPQVALQEAESHLCLVLLQLWLLACIHGSLGTTFPEGSNSLIQYSATIEQSAYKDMMLTEASLYADHSFIAEY